MIWAKRPGAHHPKAWQAQPAVFLQGEPAQESVILHDQQKAKPRAARAGEPPRPQERGREGR
jgi:hypothetical protein